MSVSNPLSTATAIENVRHASSAQRMKEKGIRFVCMLCALLSVGTTIGIVFTLAGEAIQFFRRVPFGDFITGTEWTPLIKPESYGVLPLLNGTLIIMIGSALIATPLGVLAAIYLSEYASPRARNIIKPILEILAGIPTVVYGYFAIMFVTPLLRNIFGRNDVDIFNGAAGFIVVGIMVLPLICSLCEDSLRAVPRQLREGAYGLGSTKVEVTAKIVVPAALSGIMAAIILALSRAVGETMAVTLAAGNEPRMTANPLQGIQTMTAYIVQVSQGDTPANSTPYYTLYAVGLTLFVITLAFNLGAKMLVRKFRQVYN